MTKHSVLLATLILLSLLTTLAQASTVTYVYTDPQGTPLIETDASGNVTAQFEYTPYGVPPTGAGPDGVGYTGHVNDPETGLVYMQARYYAPEIGRFASVDPVGPKPGDIFSFNRYGYANNNPSVNVDPDGRKVLFQQGASQDFKENFALAVRYLKSEGAAGNLAELQASKDIFYISPTADRNNAYTTQYDPNSNTIQWADKSGLLLKDTKSDTIKPATPALALGHEAQHALDDMKGTYHKDRSSGDKQYGNKEERKVIENYENGAADKLGEPVRNDHYGHGSVPCTTPIKC